MRFRSLSLLAAALSLALPQPQSYARTPHGEAKSPAPLNTRVFYGALVISDTAKRNLLSPLIPEKPLLPPSVFEGLLPPDFKYRVSPLRPEPSQKPEILKPSGRNQPVPIPAQGTQRL